MSSNSISIAPRIACVVVIQLAFALPALAASPRLPGTDGIVWATAVSGRTLYLGGEFTHAGPIAGPAGILDKSTGNLTRFFDVDGTVNAIASDRAGGWYLGGQFSSVNGVSRFHLAHVLAGGTVSSWDPHPNDYVYALAVSGNTLYVGGGFGQISGQVRGHLVAYDLTNETLSSWSPMVTKFGSPDEGDVAALTVDGTTLYLGGQFHSCGGQSRANVAAVDLPSGSTTTWNPGATGGSNAVYALAATPSVVYIGGGFGTCGGFPRVNLAAVNKSGGTATAWNPGMGSGSLVRALAASASAVYVGGSFTTIAGVSRRGIAALDPTTGSAGTWNTACDGSINALVLDASTLYVAGAFATIGGQPRRNLATLDAASALASAWDPDPNQICKAISIDGDRVGAGGSFYGFRWATRNRLAAFDLDTRELLPWNPDASHIVHELVASPDAIYAGGGFLTIGGQSRRCLAAIDPVSGAPTAWNPDVNADVYAIVLDQGLVYAGGSFSTVGGQARGRIAAIDAGTGVATEWNPNANTTVWSLAISGSTVYAGGAFANIGTQPRSRIAALDAATGLATTWAPEANELVRTLLVDGDRVYAGGRFTAIGGNFRRGVAALDVSSGASTGWNANLTSMGSLIVETMTLDAGQLYLGGTFDHIGGQEHWYAAAVDAADAAPVAWDPDAAGPVYALTLGGHQLVLGGLFTQLEGHRQPFVGDVTAPVLGVPEIVASSRVLLESAPNPAHLGTSLSFSMPRAAQVVLRVFDIAGREVARVVDDERLEAGAHRRHLETRHWAPGIYLCRLEAGDLRVSRRLIVAR